jgi:hypothetical protein
MTATVAWMGYYNFRVTGDALRFPYQVHDATYTVAPHFVWQPLRERPAYGNARLAEVHGELEVGQWAGGRPFSNWVLQSGRRIVSMLDAWLQPMIFAVPLLLLPTVARRDPWIAFGAMVLCIVGCAFLLITWIFQSHYAAPVGGLALAVLLACVARFHLWQWRGYAVGKAVLRAAFVVTLVVAGRTVMINSNQELNGAGMIRGRFETVLGNEPGEHLVVVRYLRGYTPHFEVVYNAADIDAAKIVWAHELSREQNAELFRYFQGRKRWLLELGPDSLRWAGYDEASPRQ